jgi:hypothetical protein
MKRELETKEEDNDNGKKFARFDDDDEVITGPTTGFFTECGAVVLIYDDEIILLLDAMTKEVLWDLGGCEDMDDVLYFPALNRIVGDRGNVWIVCDLAAMNMRVVSIVSNTEEGSWISDCGNRTVTCSASRFDVWDLDSERMLFTLNDCYDVLDGSYSPAFFAMHDKYLIYTPQKQVDRIASFIVDGTSGEFIRRIDELNLSGVQVVLGTDQRLAALLGCDSITVVDLVAGIKVFEKKLLCSCACFGASDSSIIICYHVETGTHLTAFTVEDGANLWDVTVQTDIVRVSEMVYSPQTVAIFILTFVSRSADSADDRQLAVIQFEATTGNEIARCTFDEFDFLYLHIYPSAPAMILL